MTRTPPPGAARERLAAHARIRRRVAAAALATFALAWGVIAYGGPMGTDTTTAATGSTGSSATSDQGASATSDQGASATGDSGDAITTGQS